jgi:hypothetical protein
MSIIVLFIKSFIIFIMMLSQGENVELEFHDYYVSTTQVDYIKKKNILQITIRMFINDFEDVITKNNNLKLDPDSNSIEINKQLNQYIIEKFKILANQEPMILDFIGKEYKTDKLQVYYEVKLFEKIKSVSFENYILFDFFKNQQNIIHFKIDKFRKSFLLDVNNPKATLFLD